MKYLTLFLLIVCFKSFSQPGSEVFIFDIQKVSDNISISNPVNISNRTGYDNQPYFYDHDRKILFVSMDLNTKTEIVSYDIKNDKTRNITKTSISEFSPTPMGKDQYFTSVVVEASGDQRLWEYKWNGKPKNVIFPNLKNVGYHAWIDEYRVGLYLLGNSPSLHIGNRLTGNTVFITDQIGRCLMANPSTKEILFVNKSDSSHWTIDRVLPDSFTTESIIETLPYAEDFCILNDGTILMGSGEMLYKFNPSTDVKWTKVIDFISLGISKPFTRLRASHNNRKLAVVFSE